MADKILSKPGQVYVKKLNERFDRDMATGKGKGKDPFDDSHPAEQYRKAVIKRFGMQGELPWEQIRSMDSNTRKGEQKQSEEEMDKVESGKPVPPAKEADPDSYKTGGKVNKTGWAKVHKGERVLTKKQQGGIGKKRTTASHVKISRKKAARKK